MRWLLLAGLQGDEIIEILFQLFLFPATSNPEYLWHYEVFVFFTKNTLPIQVLKIYITAKVQIKKWYQINKPSEKHCRL